MRFRARQLTLHLQVGGLVATLAPMQQLDYREWIARGLAHALLADRRRPGATAAPALHARAAAALGEWPDWLISSA